MNPEGNKTLIIILVIFAFVFSLSLFINLPALQGNFLFADEAIYYSMTQSLAQDFDLEYTKKDLIRYYETFDAGPLGIFLKKGKEGKLFFAKSYAYPLFAAPFVRLFGSNGFLVFHSILLLVLLLMGFTYFSIENEASLSLVSILTFLFASVAGVYIFWISPDFFNLSLVFSALFFWLYKHKPSPVENQNTPGMRFQSFLLSDWSDYLASFLVGIAVFSKPPNIVLMGPLVLYSLLKRQIGKAVLITLVFTVTAGAFFGVNHLTTGEWNYQGGERKTFYGEGGYPLEKDTITFDSARGGLMSSEAYTEKHLLPAKFAFINLFYYFFGRFTGLTWYFFPAILALFLFLFRRKQLDEWLLFVTPMASLRHSFWRDSDLCGPHAG